MDDFINHEYTTEYVRALVPERNALLRELEAFAKDEENHVPIVQPEVAQLLATLINIRKPKRILEIGTAIGYSAIFMAEEAPGAQIVTIERYQKMVGLANENIKRANLQDRITVLEGEAVELLDTLDDSFDLIFLDAAKGQYLQFLEPCLSLLSPGGILFSDNVLYKGMIANNDLLIRRKITIVKRLRKFLTAIMEDPRLQSSVIPIGDGVAISYKKEHPNE